uniref:Nucleotide-diphospho-sugar transferase domain-containing protein n=1 Tax=Oryza rufipogon TaxID=4529 RepID=A0A0E0NJD0_ORYRU
MARPHIVARTSATSLRHFPGHSKPSLPLSAPALRKAAAALLLAAAVALPCAVLYRAAVLDAVQPVQVGWDRGPWWERGQPPPAVVVPEEDGDVDPAAADDLDSDDLKLEQVLQEASMDNKTIILTTLNAAWASSGSVIDLFIDSFRRGVRTSSLLRHLVIITFDWKAYKRCMKIHAYCFALATENVDFSQEKRFLTAGYLDMMWKRLDFLRLVLEKGYSFIFSDADITWFRNPFPHFYPDGDFQIACDHYVGNATDLGNIANGGFNYVRSNNQNIGLKIKFLSTTYFGGICEPSRDLNKSHNGRLEELYVYATKLKKIWGIVMGGTTKLQGKRGYYIINFANFDAFS